MRDDSRWYRFENGAWRNGHSAPHLQAPVSASVSPSGDLNVDVTNSQSSGQDIVSSDPNGFQIVADLDSSITSLNDDGSSQDQATYDGVVATWAARTGRPVRQAGP